MMKYVLLLLITQYGSGAGLTAEFNTLAACESAAEKIISSKGGSLISKRKGPVGELFHSFVCVPKG